MAIFLKLCHEWFPDTMKQLSLRATNQGHGKSSISDAHLPAQLLHDVLFLLSH